MTDTLQVREGETLGDWIARVGAPRPDVTRMEMSMLYVEHGGSFGRPFLDEQRFAASPPPVEPPKPCKHWMEHGSPLCSRCGATQDECLRTGGYNSPEGWNPHGGGDLAGTQQTAMGQPAGSLGGVRLARQADASAPGGISGFSVQTDWYTMPDTGKSRLRSISIPAGATPEKPHADATVTTVAFDCECRAHHKVHRSAFGHGFRCRCGRTLMVLSDGHAWSATGEPTGFWAKTLESATKPAEIGHPPNPSPPGAEP